MKLARHAACAVSLIVAAGAGTSAGAQQTPTAPATPVASRVVMLRVSVSDIDRSVRFYREVFGWGAPQGGQPAGAQAGQQSRTSAGSQPAGAAQQGGAPASQRIFVLPAPDTARVVLNLGPRRGGSSFAVEVNDIEAIVARVIPAGGSFIEPLSARSFYRYAFVADPDGNEIEVIQTGRPDR